MACWKNLNDGLFKFSHNRIREGAYSLLPGGIVRQEIRLRIGRQLRLLKEKNPNKSGHLHHLLFQTVRQLNLGTKLITSETEMIALAELNCLYSTPPSFPRLVSSVRVWICWEELHGLGNMICVSR
jgi:hypothetical protein